MRATKASLYLAEQYLKRHGNDLQLAIKEYEAHTKAHPVDTSSKKHKP